MKNNLREILKNMHDSYAEDLTDYDNAFGDAKEKKRHDKLLKKQKHKRHTKSKRNSSTDKQRWLDGDGPQTD